MNLQFYPGVNDFANSTPYYNEYMILKNIYYLLICIIVLAMKNDISFIRRNLFDLDTAAAAPAKGTG